jgi:hypothetical protein
VIPMSTTDPLPVPGSTVFATVAGQAVPLTVVRYSHGLVFTSDWRSWWCRQPDHVDGEPSCGGADRLHLHGAPALGQVAA